ncbi:MAG TPA: protein-disulfide reductase DsbD family protein [Alphaproteobacteria bacterium]|nr:protein-disulfide reductase DsbD family protein [Alphaproteobacteria bacterium]
MTKTGLIFALVAMFGLGGGSSAYADTTKDGVPRYVTTNVIPEKDAIMAGETLTIAIQQLHAPEWHTYWKNPGDSGESTSISWRLPEGFKAGYLEHPAPHKIPYGPLMNYGFGGEVVLLTTITAPDHVQGEEVTLTADISWLVCKDICVPEFTKATLVLPVATVQNSAHETDPEFFAHVRAAMPQQVVWQGMLEEQDQTLELTFKPDEAALAELAHASDLFFFPEEWGILLNAAPQEFKVENGHLNIVVQRDTRPLSAIKDLKAVLRYTTENQIEKAVALDMAVTAAPMQQKETTAAFTPLPSPEETVTIPQAIILAILGGLILNLMPCVFPVLSMKALSLVKMSSREQKHAALHGIFYTAGIMVCFAGIATALIALKSVGEEIGWGFQLQNPVVVLLLAYLLFVMALNMSGFFEFKGHLFSNIGHKLAAHHGYAGTFFTGMLATIVATPCTAPFMGTAMGFALTQPATLALSVFLALGLGLALPYLALCFIPALRHSLPKPGAWMETFRQFMAFPLYASVAWLVWVYAQQVSGDYGVLLSLTGLILIAFSVWITRHTPTKQPWKTGIHALSYSAIIIALLIVALSMMKAPEEMSAANGNGNGHFLDSVAYTKQAYDDAIAGNEPVFVNMTAAWCITCKVNDKIALSTDSTKVLFEDKKIVYLMGDWTNRNSEITEFLASYGRSGVPLYVYVGPRDDASGERPAPQVLPQILTSGLVADVINGEDQ